MLREPTGPASAELVIKRSRFIAEARPVTSVAAAEATLAETREAYPDANHVVYAFLIGDMRSEQAGVSDAGEPKGTAGRPVLDVLRGSGIRDVIVTVVRYFGGTKLGTGGLVHAYGGAAKEVLGRVPTRERVERRTVSCRVSYELLERIRVEISHHGGVVTHEEFGTSVGLTWEIPASSLPALTNRIRDLSRGGAQVNVQE